MSSKPVATPEPSDETIPPVSDEVLRAARAAALDIDKLVQQVDQVLGEELYWFPVRHHSPTIARHLAVCIKERKPRIIFIEGPDEAQGMIEFLIDAKTKPPVAIYSSFREDVPPPETDPAIVPTPGNPANGPAVPPGAPAGSSGAPASPANIPSVPGPMLPGLAAVPRRASVWYPIVSYSPEYIAMTVARQINAKTVFIDLPHYALGEPHPLLPVMRLPKPESPIDEDDEMPPVAQTAGAPAASTVPAPSATPVPASPQTVPGEDDTDEDDSAPKPMHRRDLDLIGQTSSLYKLLAQAAGFRSWDETWDRLFETPRHGQTYEAYRRDIAIFCAAVRATTAPGSMALDGTLPRERFMWRKIQQTLSELKIDPKDAMVVCGGFHLFMNRADPTPAPPIPKGTLMVTVTPYSYFRISELSGYGAGNRAPRFYELCFEHHSNGSGQENVVVDYVVDVIKEARKQGESLSSADAIGAAQHSLMLAHLRGRHAPVLDDIRDALITCCCKGNPKTDATHLLQAIDEVNIGTRIGRVTDRIGRLPIINDFYEQLERLDLEILAKHEKIQTFMLDKRQPLDLARSAFFHRLIFLGVEIGTVAREAAPFGQSIFKEQWRLKWSPQIEPALMEKSLHGDTVETSAMTVLLESLGAAANDAGPACRRLVQAVDMDLPLLVARADQAAGHAVDHDERFHSLADAMTSLMLLERYAAYRGMGKQRLSDLIIRCFVRACFAIPEVACVAEDQWEQVIGGLLALAEPVVQRTDLDADLFAASVENAAKASTMPFLRGAFLGILTEMRRMKADSLAAELLNYARGGTDQQIVAGDFLHGVLKVSRTAILLGATSLVAAVDELLRAAHPDTFLSMVPRLRSAFESLQRRQIDSVAMHVAELYGLKEGESVQKLSTSVGMANLMAELDSKVAQIMAEWIGNK